MFFCGGNPIYAADISLQQIRRNVLFEVLQYLQSFDSQLLCLRRRNHINQGVSSHVQKHIQAMITYPDAAAVQIPTPDLSVLLVFCSE